MVRWSVLGSWTALRLTSMELVGLSCGPPDAGALAAMLGAGCGATLQRLVLGDARTLSFVPDLAVAAALRACSPSALRHLDLSGCLEVTDAGLAPVAALAALRELVLHNCMKIAAGAVEAVSRLPALRALSLRGCSQLGDHHIAALLRGAAALEELSLQTCNGITGSCLASLPSRAPRLADLNLSHCMRLEERHLHHLSRLPALRRLDLAGCMAPGAQGLACLAALSALTALGAAGWTQRGPAAAQRHAAQQQHAAAAAPGAQPPQRGEGGAPGPSAHAGADTPSSAASSGSYQADAWQLPPQVQRLDMRGASLTRGAMRRLLRSLPPVLQHLDLSQCQIVPEDSGWGIGSGGGGSGDGGGRGVSQLLGGRSAQAAGRGGAWTGDVLPQGPPGDQQQQMSGADLRPLSALTALTALFVSGVGVGAAAAAAPRGGCAEASAFARILGRDCGGGGGGGGSGGSGAPAACSWPGPFQGMAGLGAQGRTAGARRLAGLMAGRAPSAAAARSDAAAEAGAARAAMSCSGSALPPPPWAR
ncbi:hypothetical protein MNEG_9454 [Monoraphidium neglectum]|uniref:Uncharacterized protein n=1 Tax=Monoraphidium neglectum TaxID=145388 RepID=A0A0D2MCF8_9CHLO|nr:hypothetical protein MNEG_9454 [Monoraphidium neglectum]KIY98511.1 hypothetical protein MNEG_9454 [Monoraphidium neglectum]|eukprot:XP_013897531.1 hypothetical protein MNEG_9454 [Monoraphidium neglectum]